jgi:methionyl-tRNA formyltransferase
MKVVIITSSRSGTPSQHLNQLLDSGCCKIELVVLSKSAARKKPRYYLRKVRKSFRIGLLGVLNGLRIRKWYTQGVNSLLDQQDLKDICIRNNVKYVEVPFINSAETESLLKSMHFDLGVSLGNAFISPRIFEIPKYGMLNIHHELLPEFQNAQSVIWQIYNKSSQTGFTIHKVSRLIDQGEILLKESFDIDFKNTLKETVVCNTAYSIQKSSKALPKLLRDFEDKYNNALPQANGLSYTTPSIVEFIRILINHRWLRKHTTKLRA